MVILNNTIAIVSLFFFFFFSIILVFSSWRSSHGRNSNRRSNLPPGPPSLPLIGHIHLLVGTLPFRSFDALAKTYGGIMHLKIGQVAVVVISSPDMAKEALKTRDPVFAAGRPDNMAARIMWYGSKNIAFAQYGDYWRQMRKICIVELLSAKSVRSIASIRSNEISNLVNSVRTSTGFAIDLTEMIFKCTSAITCRAAYGKVCRDKDALTNLMDEALKVAGGFTLADLFPSSKLLNTLSWNKYKLLRMHRRLNVILDGIINEHKVNLARINEDESEERDARKRAGNGEFGNEDLVDVLLRVQATGELQFPIDNDHIKAVIFVRSVASVSATTDWAMVELMRNPRVMAKAQAEVREAALKLDGHGQFEESEVANKLKYLKLVIKEVLRLHSVAPFVPRASSEDSEINGYYIPAKTRVLVNTWAMGRNPDYFPNPERFQPERFENNGIDLIGGNFEYLPFGAGKRMCPGMTYGLIGVELPLAHLLYHFDWQLPQGMKGTDLDMIEISGISAPRKHHLHILATPYNNIVSS